jgi:hypothetical protein
MKKLIDDSGGFKTYFELRPFTNPAHAGWASLIVTTVWEGARSTVEEHKQYELNLDPMALKNLKDFLNEVTDE